MTSTSLIKFILIVFTGILLQNCTKEKKNTEKEPPTYEELLTSHVWNGIEVTRYVNGNVSSTNSISNLKYVFTDDFKYKKYDNNTMIQDGTWEIVNSSTIYFVRTRYFDANLNHNILDDLQIIQLTSDIFEYSVPFIDNSGDIKRDQFKYGR